MSKILLIILLLSAYPGIAQKYKSTSGTIKFYSEELLEDITAINKDVKSVFDIESGQIVFSLPITGFEFAKSLMQEHFNEKYLESEKYPKATFKGIITGYQANTKNPNVEAEGELEIHGVKQKIKVQGSLDFIGEKLIIHTVFMIKLVDYKITVPKLMFQKIAEEIEVTLDIEYKAYEK
jgi:polyisoprenoid-binding protein YceI